MRWGCSSEPEIRDNREKQPGVGAKSAMKSETLSLGLALYSEVPDCTDRSVSTGARFASLLIFKAGVLEE